MAQIVVDGVRHMYRPPRGKPVLALEEVSLEVREREFLALLGPSGCGKSTLLYLIGGFLPVEGGSIVVDGKPVAAPGPDRGIVFQHFALFPWKTVRGNILYGLERQGMPLEVRQYGDQCTAIRYVPARGTRRTRLDWRKASTAALVIARACGTA